MEFTNAQRAEILTQALPYIQGYAGKLVVIKYGGNAMLNDSLKKQVMSDIVLLAQVGVKVILVHGGGPEISSLLKKIGKQSEFLDGLRVTDRETIDVVQMVLAGKVNKDLVNGLELAGGKALGISGIDGQLLLATATDARLGFVGDVTQVNPQPIFDLLEKGYIPVISTIGCDTVGNIYNINADTAAAAIAGAVGAESFIAMTDISGILADHKDPTTLIPLIDVADAERLFADGTISGGMIPKVACCIDAIGRGVEKVFIIDGRIPHAILVEMLTDEGIGTMFVKEKKQ